METKQYFKLIKGDFTSKAAKSMLYDLINRKINFHNKEAFSKKIKTSGDTSLSQKRIDELTETYEKMEQLIQYASKHHLKLEINGIIEINLIK